MDVIILVAGAYLIAPFGLLLIAIAALSLRHAMKIRARSILVLCALLALLVFGAVPIGQVIGNRTVEGLAVAAGGLVVLVAVTLFFRAPASQNRALVFNAIGLGCIAIGAWAFSILVNTNFGL